MLKRRTISSLWLNASFRLDLSRTRLFRFRGDDRDKLLKIFDAHTCTIAASVFDAQSIAFHVVYHLAHPYCANRCLWVGVINLWCIHFGEVDDFLFAKCIASEHMEFANWNILVIKTLSPSGQVAESSITFCFSWFTTTISKSIRSMRPFYL